MIIKKKAEEIERRNAYAKRVIQLLYPEEQGTSLQNSNPDQDNGPSLSSESLEGAAEAKKAHDIVAQDDNNSISGNCKVYGADIPLEILQKSQLLGRDSESSSDDEHTTDEPLTRKRRKRRGNKNPIPLHLMKSSCVNETTDDGAKSPGKLSRNKKRKMKKKAKKAQEKPDTFEFVYKNVNDTIHSIDSQASDRLWNATCFLVFS